MVFHTLRVRFYFTRLLYFDGLFKLTFIECTIGYDIRLIGGLRLLFVGIYLLLGGSGWPGDISRNGIKFNFLYVNKINLVSLDVVLFFLMLLFDNYSLLVLSYKFVQIIFCILL